MEELKTRCNVLGNSPGASSAMTGLTNGYIYEMDRKGKCASNEQLTVTYCEEDAGYGFFRACTRINAKKPLFLTQLSCLFLNGIFAGRDFMNDDTLFLYLCRQTWEGEGQWEKIPLSHLRFYSKSSHHSTDSLHIINIGSNTTANLYPNLFLADERERKIWAFQFEPIGNYHIEIGYDRGGQSVFVNFECISDQYLQSGVSLQAGESLQSEFVTYGEISGDLNDALAALTMFRRRQFSGNKPCPLVFNDYMNALWGNPDREKLLPLIDSAAQLGAEIFCIDAGWFMEKGKNWDQSLGDWVPSSDRFGPEGFASIVAYIRQKGMLAGCWMEMECVSSDASVFSKPDNWFLVKYGKRIGGGVRHFFNYENSDVCRYMRGKVEALYQLGIRYIKNDYNSCIGSGVDFGDGNSLGIGVNRAVRAFLAFIDRLKEEFPDLRIENCGSGAMRSDYATLSHFDLQSVTDQEDSVCSHSVTVGTLFNILPEHMGVWTCPYPLDFAHMQDVGYLRSKEYRRRMADGEETVFAMANGMLGNMYLSGRPDCADVLNEQKIIDGIRFFKQNRSIIFKGIPQILTPLPHMWGQSEFSAVFYKYEGQGLLFVFRLGKKETLQLDMSRYFQNMKVRIAYGSGEGKKLLKRKNKLYLTMKKEKSALVIKIAGKRQEDE